MWWECRRRDGLVLMYDQLLMVTFCKVNTQDGNAESVWEGLGIVLNSKAAASYRSEIQLAPS